LAHIQVYPRVNYRDLWFPEIVMSEVVATIRPGIVLDTSFIRNRYLRLESSTWGGLDVRRE
jgi:hypothetical protein